MNRDRWNAWGALIQALIDATLDGRCDWRDANGTHSHRIDDVSYELTHGADAVPFLWLKSPRWRHPWMTMHPLVGELAKLVATTTAYNDVSDTVTLRGMATTVAQHNRQENTP